MYLFKIFTNKNFYQIFFILTFKEAICVFLLIIVNISKYSCAQIILLLQ